MFRYISYLSKAPKQSYCNKFYYNTIPSRTFCLKRTLDLKYIDISDTSNMAECKRAVEYFEKYGIMVIKDPRVDSNQNSQFIDMMESYYAEASVRYESGEKMDEFKPENACSVGIQPSKREIARDHTETIKNFAASELPLSKMPPTPDTKWRYAYRIGEDKNTGMGFVHPNVYPRNRPEFAGIMDSWGENMVRSVSDVAEMLARGYDLEADYFTSMMKDASHYLAPTGSDLARYNKLHHVLAHFHYDFSFITIHGKSRFPGLYVWLRDGTRLAVKIPDGCLLQQAAKQLEWVTGGKIFAGMHEVIVSEETIKSVEKAKAEGKSLWRISSTMFAGVRYDLELKPEGIFKNTESLKKYPPTLALDQCQDEFKAIKMMQE